MIKKLNQDLKNMKNKMNIMSNKLDLYSNKASPFIQDQLELQKLERLQQDFPIWC